MTASKAHTTLIIPSLIWLGVLAAALLGAYLRGGDLFGLWPMALIGSVPAVLGLLLTPVMRQEWAQIVMMFAWVALAVIACGAIGFVPMALMFLTVPAIGMLFFREKVVEALFIAAIIACVLFFAGREGYIPEAPITDAQALWGQQTGLMGTIALVIGSMFASAQSRRGPVIAAETKSIALWREGINGGLFEFDADGVLISANETGAKQFGLSDAHGAVTLSNLIPHDDRAQDMFSDAVYQSQRGGAPQSLRLTLPENGQSLTHLDMYLTPLKNKGMLLHTIDRSEDEGRIETLRRSNNSAQQDSVDKTLFFAGVSHELRTPLNAIIGFSDMMRSRLFGPLPGKYAEYADLIHDSGQHMLDLIGDVLDLSKAEAGKYELTYDNFDIADVVRSSVKMIRPAADAAEVMIDVDIPENDPLIVQADRRAMRQILLNLLSNAVKFSAKGERVFVHSRQQGDDLILSVRDEGAGMSADELARIGEPYAQGTQGTLTAERGTGLGLSLVQSLTELHGGKMEIASTQGVGTEVQLTLPLTAP
ncbi:ATP-binding protein [Litorimonas sp. RW-G-Af-16]|uniref:sensor histidine kinase n=1 Tax=Litorimonas sp. RW-G-Af-16 TaxID=3241168 RepID=UPI00390C45FC